MKPKDAPDHVFENPPKGGNLNATAHWKYSVTARVDEELVLSTRERRVHLFRPRQ
jgi:hypothetical protein